MEAKRRLEYRWKMAGCLLTLFVLLIWELACPSRVYADNGSKVTAAWCEYDSEEGMTGIFLGGMVYSELVDK